MKNDAFALSSDYWLRRAKRYGDQNDPLRALPLLRHAVEIDPSNAEVRLACGEALFSLGNYEAAFEEASAAHAADAELCAPIRLLGRCLMRLGNAGEAGDAYALYVNHYRAQNGVWPPFDDTIYEVEDARKDRPQMQARRHGLGRICERHMERGDLEKAQEVLLHLPELKAETHLLAALLAEKKGDREEAFSMAILAAYTDQEQQSAHFNLQLCKLLWRLQEEPLAEVMLMRAAMSAILPSELSELCIAASAMGKERVALSALYDHLERLPYRVPLLHDACVLCARLGELAPALRMKQRMLSAAQDDAQAQALGEKLSEWAGEDAQAIAEEAKALAFYTTPQGTFYAHCAEQGMAASSVPLAPFIRKDPSAEAALVEALSALPKEEGERLLRELLLHLVSVPHMRRFVLLQLKALGAKPPFMVLQKHRLMQVDPSAPPAPTPSFLQRRLYQCVQLTYARLRMPDIIPYAAALLTALTPSAQRALVGHLIELTPLAIAMRFCHQRGLPPPRVDTHELFICQLLLRHTQALLDQRKEEQG